MAQKRTPDSPRTCLQQLENTLDLYHPSLDTAFVHTIARTMDLMLEAHPSDDPIRPLDVAIRSRSIGLMRTLTTYYDHHDVPALTTATNLLSWPNEDRLELWDLAYGLFGTTHPACLIKMGHDALSSSNVALIRRVLDPACTVPVAGTGPNSGVDWLSVLGTPWVPSPSLWNAYVVRIRTTLHDPHRGQEAMQRVLISAHHTSAKAFLTMMAIRPQAAEHLHSALGSFDLHQFPPHGWSRMLAEHCTSNHRALAFCANIRTALETFHPTRESAAVCERVLLQAAGCEDRRALRRLRQEGYQRARGRTPGPKGGTLHPNRTPSV